MNQVGLIMAGGSGDRMRRSHTLVPKPLVPVCGVSLLERNLLSLLGAGVREIFVSAPCRFPEIARYVETRGSELGRALGARVSPLVENAPLGTIGCAALLRDRADEVLVVNADNLCGMRWNAFFHAHTRREAALTLASHTHGYRFPFGILEVEGDRIVAYHEKPLHYERTSSAISLLGRDALRALVPGEAASLPELVHRMLASGATVCSYDHDSPWIDVNDAEAVFQAELMLRRHPEALECFWSSPDIEVVGGLLWSKDHLLLEWRPHDALLHAGLWDTPGGKIEVGESADEAIARECEEELGVRLPWSERIAVFDDIDTASGLVVRHHVFRSQAAPEMLRPQSGFQLRAFALDQLAELDGLSPIVLRSLATIESQGLSRR